MQQVASIYFQPVSRDNFSVFFLKRGIEEKTPINLYQKEQVYLVIPVPPKRAIFDICVLKRLRRSLRHFWLLGVVI